MSANTSTTSTKISFDRFGLIFLGLIPLVLLGFWKSYFSKFFEETSGLTWYMHFHAILMTAWVALLILQPVLIKEKKVKIHRLVGKFSYLLVPLILVSMLLLIHKAGNMKPVERQTFVDASFGLLGLFVFGACYVTAVINRKRTAIHARAMVGTGLALLDPTLMRILGPFSFPLGFFMAVGIILGTFIFLIVLERKQASGRWVFPSLLSIYFIIYFLAAFQFYTHDSINLSLLDSFMKWFYALPLT
jgi:hypothetical protein